MIEKIVIRDHWRKMDLGIYVRLDPNSPSRLLGLAMYDADQKIWRIGVREGGQLRKIDEEEDILDAMDKVDSRLKQNSGQDHE